MTYILNIFNSMFSCLHIRQLQMIFTSQIVLEISLSKYVFINVGFRLFFVLKNFNHQQLQIVLMNCHIFFFQFF